MAKLCERLKIALQTRGMRPSMLSYKTGISEAALSHYIKGDYEPKNEKLKKIAQALRVSEAWLSGFDVPMTDSMSHDDYTVYSEKSKNGVKIPILGYVAAGIPIEAITDIIDYEEINSDMLRGNAEYFGLEIKGDSMEPVISNGDYVIVKKQPTCDSGQIAIVCVNGDNATCKKVVRQESGIMLVPFNPQYETVFYSNEQIEQIPITIFGVVAEQRRKFMKV